MPWSTIFVNVFAEDDKAVVLGVGGDQSVKRARAGFNNVRKRELYPFVWSVFVGLDNEQYGRLAERIGLSAEDASDWLG